MSYLFYGWWDYRFCGLMLVSTLIDYVAGRLVFQAQKPRIKKTWMIVSIVMNLGLLGFFKYFDLMADSLNQLALWLGAGHPLISLLKVTLPVGISFYTFQSMSYSIDIYRGAAQPARGFWDFACYVSLSNWSLAPSFAITNWPPNWSSAPIRRTRPPRGSPFLCWDWPRRSSWPTAWRRWWRNLR